MVINQAIEEIHIYLNWGGVSSIDIMSVFKIK